MFHGDIAANGYGVHARLEEAADGLLWRAYGVRTIGPPFTLKEVVRSASRPIGSPKGLINVQYRGLSRRLTGLYAAAPSMCAARPGSCSASQACSRLSGSQAVGRLDSPGTRSFAPAAAKGRRDVTARRGRCACVIRILRLFLLSGG